MTARGIGMAMIVIPALLCALGLIVSVVMLAVDLWQVERGVFLTVVGLIAWGVVACILIGRK